MSMNSGFIRIVPSQVASLLFFLFIRHGDMLFLSQEISATVNDTSEASSFPLSTSTTVAPMASSSVKEDEIDIFLSKQDGLIHRGRDPQL